MNKTFLLTGATGSLGTQIALILVRETQDNILVLVRARDKESTVRRLSRSWWDHQELASAIGGRVKVLVGDVSQPKLGLNDSDYNETVRTVTHIIHSAADLRLNGPIDELRRVNAGGTANILELAHAVHKDHKLERLSYVSTAYVAGGRQGAVPEDSLTDKYGFWSRYELSKFESESLVQKAKAQLPISIFRPGLITGDSKSGAINTFNTIYFPLRLYLTRKPIVIPTNPDIRVNMVPVDYCANAVVKLTSMPEAIGMTFHLVAPWDKTPTVPEMIQFLRKFARERMHVNIPAPLFLPTPIPATRARFRAQTALARNLENVLDPLLTIAPYFNEKRRFMRDNIDRLLGPYDFHWQEVMKPMMEYAISRNFLHRSERTIHEQILFRLQSRSMPITYHDFVDGTVVTHDSKAVRNEMMSAAAALKAMGIGKGDRVALVGNNSTRYLVMDVAIGLAGAVSVPLYATCPPHEVDQILAASRAKILFAGAAGILERIDELKSETPVVSFCRQQPKCQPERKIVSWDEFIKKAEGKKTEATAPVVFSDLASIRYTSGTTGQMKGACFDHQNLRWLAENICSFMDSWRGFDKQASYLSYLPMSHVVEGIMATYSPYYMRSSFDIYFLEDMKHLVPALRQVRPHMFFSVPRFYEKVYEALSKTKLYKLYAGMSESPRRALLRNILRRGVLKKAGLNRCKHLVVGSAPMSEKLLSDFQKLGIEVHNAYGLTEAPLVTMNKLGANRVNTVGEAMPETEIRIAEDGEIMVRGPQVARGIIIDDKMAPFKDGWLATGDLGYITEQNSLVLKGRKREIIVTSYGKNIHPTRIESMLRCIPDVSEAMILGEGRPFCTAIIWVTLDTSEYAHLIDRIRQAILEINKQLSHPEQVKRWAILKNELSIERGEITASLKLKRTEVTKRLTHIVDALYEEPQPTLNDVLDICCVEEGE